VSFEELNQGATANAPGRGCEIWNGQLRARQTADVRLNEFVAFFTGYAKMVPQVFHFAPKVHRLDCHVVELLAGAHHYFECIYRAFWPAVLIFERAKDLRTHVLSGYQLRHQHAQSEASVYQRIVQRLHIT